MPAFLHKKPIETIRSKGMSFQAESISSCEKLESMMGRVTG
jgi:hypothetical protein